MSGSRNIEPGLVAALILVLVVGLLAWGGSGLCQEKPRPLLTDGVEFADCGGCHKGQAALPSGHPSSADPAWPACGKCHGGEKSLRTKVPLEHLHRMNGLECADCHDQEGGPRALTPEECLKCHGPYGELIKKTSGLERNPHDSHYRDTLGCDACHQAHSKSENYCATCHNWSLKVP